MYLIRFACVWSTSRDIPYYCLVVHLETSEISRHMFEFLVHSFFMRGIGIFSDGPTTHSSEAEHDGTMNERRA